MVKCETWWWRWPWWWRWGSSIASHKLKSCKHNINIHILLCPVRRWWYPASFHSWITSVGWFKLQSRQREKKDRNRFSSWWTICGTNLFKMNDSSSWWLQLCQVPMVLFDPSRYMIQQGRKQSRRATKWPNDPESCLCTKKNSRNSSYKYNALRNECPPIAIDAL